MEGQKIQLKCLHKTQKFFLFPCTLQNANEYVFELIEIFEHSVGLKILQVKTCKDIFVVYAILLQSNTIKVNSFQAIDEIPLLFLLHPTFCRQGPAQANRLNDECTLFPIFDGFFVEVYFNFLINLS